MRLKCTFGFHDWSKDCERCASCSQRRQNAHAWDGCTCSKCRAIHHAWDGCTCSKCKATRNDGHTWSGRKCSKCGSTPHDLKPGATVPVGGRYYCVLCAKGANVARYGLPGIASYRAGMEKARAAAAFFLETKKQFEFGTTFDSCGRHREETRWSLE